MTLQPDPDHRDGFRSFDRCVDDRFFWAHRQRYGCYHWSHVGFAAHDTNFRRCSRHASRKYTPVGSIPFERVDWRYPRCRLGLSGGLPQWTFDTATPEMLARTQPHLLDLFVAVFAPGAQLSVV